MWWRRLSCFVFVMVAGSCNAMYGTCDLTEAGVGGTAGSGGMAGADGGGAGSSTGAGSPGGGGASAGGGGSAAIVWHDYAMPLKGVVSAGIWERTRLDQLWPENADAPPFTGIVAAVRLSDFDRLIVLADDGYCYVRKDGQWLTRRLISDLFPQLSSPRAVQHVPASWAGDPPVYEGLHFTDNPDVHIYDYNANDSVVYVTTIPLTEINGSPPYTSGVALWTFAHYDPPDQPGAGDAYFWEQYDDGIVYRQDEAFQGWTTWQAGASPLWQGGGATPPTDEVAAAYYDEPNEVLHLIAP